MLEAILLLVAGIILLIAGGEGTVRGGTALAHRFNMQPYVIGATVVAFGTSAPELAVTLTASLQDSPGLALGNIVGSNIANLGLILGLSAIVTPIFLSRATIKREFWIIIGVVALLLLFAWDRSIERWEGIILMLAMGVVLVRTLRNPAPEISVTEEYDVHWSLPVAIPVVLIGLLSLYFGGRLLVSGAVFIAEALGMAEWVIGVVIVALGTSMPEVAASVVAAIRGRGDIALGNVIGSNTFNVLLVLGAGATIKPMQVQVNITLDLLVVTGLTLIPAVMLITRSRVPRIAGFVLLIGYLAYLTAKVVGV